MTSMTCVLEGEKREWDEKALHNFTNHSIAAVFFVLFGFKKMSQLFKGRKQISLAAGQL